MQAIITKYIGPTNTKGARIKATASAGSVTIGYPHELERDERHALAAKKLCEKFGWEWNHVGGELPDLSQVFVKLP
jgi:hypothetical protein